jgi:predicted membrane channel-forming protein YqfA (hemolysin III family)
MQTRCILAALVALYLVKVKLGLTLLALVLLVATLTRVTKMVRQDSFPRLARPTQLRLPVALGWSNHHTCVGSISLDYI